MFGRLYKCVYFTKIPTAIKFEFVRPTAKITKIISGCRVSTPCFLRERKSSSCCSQLLTKNENERNNFKKQNVFYGIKNIYKK